MANKIPYSIIDYKEIVEKGMYIDKTAYIAEIEQNLKCASLFRPRRFGKSLLLSTMYYYFDYKYESDFEKLFKGTCAYENPSPNKNKYSVLLFDFSGIEAYSLEKAYDEMKEKVASSIMAFLDENSYELSHEMDYTLSPALILFKTCIHIVP
jgi:hypothetical protein